MRYTRFGMAIVLPEPARASIQDDGVSIRLIIPARREWGAFAFISFWLVGWAVGEGCAAFALGSVIGQGEPWTLLPGLFLVAWLGGWTVGGIAAMRQWAWLLRGREIVEIRNRSITLSGRGRPKEYASDHVRRLRVDGQLMFDYGSETVSFAEGIDEAEALDLLKLIARRFPMLTEDRAA